MLAEQEVTRLKLSAKDLSVSQTTFVTALVDATDSVVP